MSWAILRADARMIPLKDKSIQCCVTSPPYWGLRDYGTAGQLGLEKTPEEYVANMVVVFREVRRVLKDDGTIWVNLGDCYAAHPGQRKDTDLAGLKQQTVRGSTALGSRCIDTLKPKDLVGIPWRVAFALQADGWYLRSDIIWSKPNPMPESVTDRPTKAHEYIFLLSKNEKYFFDQDAVKESAINDRKRGTHNYSHVPGGGDNSGLAHGVFENRNIRSVWTITTKGFPGSHFAVFPPEIPERCIKAGSRSGDIILDPFSGSGTTALMADKLGRFGIGLELSEDYCQMASGRCYNDAPLFNL